MEKLRCDQLILGAGVIGLAAARRIGNKHTILLEAHDGFGRETSSRNSEVIHSGIHYPSDSWKTRLCVDGRALLVPFLGKHQVPFKECGKLVVAEDADEMAYLFRLADHSARLQVPCEMWSAEQVTKSEPHVRAHGALHFPRSGILDSHSFMALLEQQALDRGVQMAYRHRVVEVARSSGGWTCQVESPDGPLEIEAPIVVNAAGLQAANLSNQALSTTDFEHRFCRGRYFQLTSRYNGAFQKLVYPVPKKDGLGVHVTLDLAGQARLGPDVDWSATAQYHCDWDALRPSFVEAASRYLPDVKPLDLLPGLVGIRPKLFLKGSAHPDFLIENTDGWVHCLGIESPGLTAALAVAERVASVGEIG